MNDVTAKELAFIGLAGQAQQAAAAGQRLALAAGVHARLLEWYHDDRYQVIRDDGALAEMLARVAVLYADALVAELGKPKRPAKS